MSLPTQSQVQSTFVHSTLALVIVEKESRQRLQLLIVVHALAHSPMMRSSTTLWHPSMTYALRCPDSPHSCTITPSVVIRSSLLSKPNWTKFKARRKWELAIPWQKGRDDDDRGSIMIGGERAWWKGEYWCWRARDRKGLCLMLSYIQYLLFCTHAL